MSERLATIHLTEPSVSGEDALFEVRLLVDDDDTALLQRYDRDHWMHMLARCKKLIVDHVEQRRTEEMW